MNCLADCPPLIVFGLEWGHGQLIRVMQDMQAGKRSAEESGHSVDQIMTEIQPLLLFFFAHKVQHLIPPPMRFFMGWAQRPPPSSASIQDFWKANPQDLFGGYPYIETRRLWTSGQVPMRVREDPLFHEEIQMDRESEEVVAGSSSNFMLTPGMISQGDANHMSTTVVKCGPPRHSKKRKHSVQPPSQTPPSLVTASSPLVSNVEQAPEIEPLEAGVVSMQTPDVESSHPSDLEPRCAEPPQPPNVGRLQIFGPGRSRSVSEEHVSPKPSISLSADGHSTREDSVTPRLVLKLPAIRPSSNLVSEMREWHYTVDQIVAPGSESEGKGSSSGKSHQPLKFVLRTNGHSSGNLRQAALQPLYSTSARTLSEVQETDSVGIAASAGEMSGPNPSSQRGRAVLEDDDWESLVDRARAEVRDAVARLLNAQTSLDLLEEALHRHRSDASKGKERAAEP
ncbi:hypothetical protein EIP91_009318 [Steccherinum ochraceum]|uniref:Uncharacterized protein n=1 Tax=Steccherinum ochraceum TaxID=92696 RepID=A0A4R0R1R6_9APHY|nr:hypothetical protein EIP91_009318 [Steccherinum ochraceum]